MLINGLCLVAQDWGKSEMSNSSLDDKFQVAARKLTELNVMQMVMQVNLWVPKDKLLMSALMAKYKGLRLESLRLIHVPL